MQQLTLKALCAAAIATCALATTSASAQVKIGFMSTLSGPAASLGQDMYDGFMLGVEQSGGKLGGATIEVLKEDDQLKPELGVQIVSKFIERDKVDIVTA